MQCVSTNLIYKLFYFYFPARNLIGQHDYEGRHSIENSQLDDLGLDKVFQDENCVAEGIKTRFFISNLSTISQWFKIMCDKREEIVDSLTKVVDFL